MPTRAKPWPPPAPNPPAGQTLSGAGIDECVRYVIARPAGSTGG